MNSSSQAERDAFVTRAPRLSVSITVFFILCGLIGLLAIWWPADRQTRDLQASLIADNALRGTKALQLAVSRAVEREWDSVRAVAAQVDPADLSEVRDFTDAVVQAGGRVAWAGFIDRGGIVRAGANGLREGENVGTRPMFRAGLRGASINQLDRDGTDSEVARPGGMAALSFPVTSTRGEPIGVFVYYLRLSWVASYVERAAEQLGYDVFVLGGENDLIASRSAEGAELSAATLGALALNITSVEIVGASDELEGAFVVAPELLLEELPPLNLRLVVRDTSTTQAGLLGKGFLTAWLYYLGAVLLVFLLLFIFLRHFLRPVEWLIGTAEDIAEGKASYPEEARSSREAEMLSHALSRIQNRMDLK